MVVFNNKGTVFITVTIIISILIIMMGLLLNITSTDVRISKSYADGVTAYYLAESGAAKAMAYALANRKQDHSETLSEISCPKSYSVTWSILYDKSVDIYTITSYTQYGRAYRKIQVLITIKNSGNITVSDWRLIN